MNQESSSDRLAFQVAHTTISPNYLGEDFETQIARSWSSLQTYHHKMEKQTSNDKSVKTPMLPELSGDNKSSPLWPSLQDNHRLMPVKSTSTSGNKHPRHQLPHSNDAAMIHLVPIDCAHEISSGTSSMTDSEFTTHRMEMLLTLRENSPSSKHLHEQSSIIWWTNTCPWHGGFTTLQPHGSVVLGACPLSHKGAIYS
jgi:hypothetical protein